MSDAPSNDYNGKNGNGNLWRDLVKLVVISGLTAGVTTYATVQTMARDIMESAIQ